MGEKAPGVARSDGGHSGINGRVECRLGAGGDFLEGGLELRKRQLNRREVRRIRRQIEQRAARLLDEGADQPRMMRTEIVHRHHLSWPQDGDEILAQPGNEPRGVHRPGLSPCRHEPAWRQRGDQRGGRAVVAGHAADGPLAAWGPRKEPGEPDSRAGFVQKDQLIGGDGGNRFPPGGALYGVLLAGVEGLFFRVQARRAMAR
jgi:hypothetical protein